MIQEGLLFATRKGVIKRFVRKRKLTIFGSESIQAQIGFFARSPGDIDIISTTPKKHARQLTNLLNTRSRSNAFFSKPAMFPGTHKVKHIGQDRQKNTRDDLEIADFGLPKRKVKTRIINGVRVTSLSESVKDKRKSLADPQFQFRARKDKEDLDRIRAFRRLKRF